MVWWLATLEHVAKGEARTANRSDVNPYCVLPTATAGLEQA